MLRCRSSIIVFASLVGMLLRSGIASADDMQAQAPQTAPARPAESMATKAPDFPFATTPFGWRHLHDLCSESALLLVFNPSDDDLVLLERSRAALTSRDLAPMAVVRQDDGDAWRTLGRLGLSYGLLSDPAGVVQEDFGLGAAGGPRDASVWLVIDRSERIRIVRRGTLVAGFEAEAVNSLAGDSDATAADPTR
ncbi:MAG TPA: hypothetical protein VL123_05035 [Candidatus Udaeobacter sp.]|jgi:hypothetical protein|nr:hypothetical protein [Candidatus Udaeobacter sp.]